MASYYTMVIVTSSNPIGENLSRRRLIAATMGITASVSLYIIFDDECWGPGFQRHTAPDYGEGSYGEGSLGC